MHPDLLIPSERNLSDLSRVKKGEEKNAFVISSSFYHR
jgi:hypothetical protein